MIKVIFIIHKGLNNGYKPDKHVKIALEGIKSGLGSTFEIERKKIFHQISALYPYYLFL